MWTMERRDLQTAADAAVLAAAWEIANNYDDNAEDAALQEAENNGYNPDANGIFNLELGEDDDGRTTVTATLSQASNTYFSNMVYRDGIRTSVVAAAVVLEPEGDFCMLSLDPSAASTFVINGNVDIDSAGCGLAANSNSDTAINVNGGAGDLIVGSVSAVGGINDAGHFTTDTILTGSSPLKDPYEDLEIPDFEGCTRNEMRDGDVKNFGTVHVFCGGWSISGSETLEAGHIYVIDGGDLDVGNGESLDGTAGATIIMTNSGGEDYGSYGRLDIKGALDIAAPIENDLDNDWGDFEGVAIYSDRTEPYNPRSNQCHDIKGDVRIHGAAYFPTTCVDIGGNADIEPADGLCTRLIATTIKLHGNPAIGNDCQTSSAKDIGSVTVRLTL